MNRLPSVDQSDEEDSLDFTLPDVADVLKSFEDTKSASNHSAKGDIKYREHSSILVAPSVPTKFDESVTKYKTRTSMRYCEKFSGAGSKELIKYMDSGELKCE
eukprot:UN08066